jgi:hypothetical protein
MLSLAILTLLFSLADILPLPAMRMPLRLRLPCYAIACCLLLTPYAFFRLSPLLHFTISDIAAMPFLHCHCRAIFAAISICFFRFSLAAIAIDFSPLHYIIAGCHIQFSFSRRLPHLLFIAMLASSFTTYATFFHYLRLPLRHYFIAADIISTLPFRHAITISLPFRCRCFRCHFRRCCCRFRYAFSLFG